MWPAAVALTEEINLQVERMDDALILHCHGHLTGERTSTTFKAAVVDLLHQHRLVTVDLGGIDSLDRSGLETMVGLYSSARTAGATLRYEHLCVPLTDSRPIKGHPGSLGG